VLEYFEQLRNQAIKYQDTAAMKLVIPSIKRDLVFRQGRNVYARPFLENFMDYLLPQDLDSSAAEQDPRFAVFLWSTAMPHTLLPMLEAFLTPWKSLILGVWNRKHLELRDATSYRTYGLLPLRSWVRRCTDFKLSA
jgi:hypothetical protein